MTILRFGIALPETRDTKNSTPSNASPSGAQTCTSAPRDVEISVYCSDSTARTALKADKSDVDIDSMRITASEDGGTQSNTLEDLDCYNQYTYYVKCEDVMDNEKDATTISFSIVTEPAGD